MAARVVMAATTAVQPTWGQGRHVRQSGGVGQEGVAAGVAMAADSGDATCMLSTPVQSPTCPLPAPSFAPLPPPLP